MTLEFYLCARKFEMTMVLPIYAYGQPVLKRVAKDIDASYPNLQELIANMWETMYFAQGVGLAAPQVGLSIRLFIIDTVQLEEKERIQEAGMKRVFINAHVVETSGDEKPYEEGCLSIPGVRGDVIRPETVRLRFMDENFVEHEETFTGMAARVIQHEYDHIDGVLFTELLNPVRRTLIRRKMDSILKGRVDADYRMKFA